jgi:hypothetical protein
MKMKNSVRRIATGLGVAGLLSAGVVLASAGSASASTIPGGQLQLCAQGNYSAFVHVLSEPLPGGGTSREFESTIQSPGQCWQEPVDTAGQWAQVDVVGIYPDGSQFYIGSESYNSSVAGMGIGAEGTTDSPYIWTW